MSFAVLQFLIMRRGEKNHHICILIAYFFFFLVLGFEPHLYFEFLCQKIFHQLIHERKAG
jgi:hypothetical protein